MSDERWLGKDERDVIGGWFQQRQPNREAFENADALLDHAEAADELIAELAEALRHVERTWNDRFRPEAAASVRRALARVDALTKDTA